MTTTKTIKISAEDARYLVFVLRDADLDAMPFPAIAQRIARQIEAAEEEGDQMTNKDRIERIADTLWPVMPRKTTRECVEEAARQAIAADPLTAQAEAMAKALEAVISEADRKTVAFDKARAALSQYRGEKS